MREVYLSEIKILIEVGAITGATLHGRQGKFYLTFHVGVEDLRLIAKAGTLRSFRDLTRAAQLLHELGIRKAVLDMEQFGSDPETSNIDQQTAAAPPLSDSLQRKKTDPDPEAEATD